MVGTSQFSGAVMPDSNAPRAYRRRRKYNLRVLKALADPNVPEECRYESLPRRSFNVTMDNALNNIKLVPGRDGRDAVLAGWINAIQTHDNIVKVVEQRMDVADAKKSLYLERQRIFQNHMIAWNQLNDNPEEYAEYRYKLKPKCQHIEDIEEYLKTIPDADEKGKVLKVFTQYKQLMPKCEKMIPFEMLVEDLRRQYEAAAKASDEADFALKDALTQEQEAAKEITEDHVIADELGKRVWEAFPTLKTGFLICKINGMSVEGNLFEDIMDMLEKAVMPHNLEFKRYDQLLNHFTRKWESYQDLRSTGRWAPDPRVEHTTFVEACRKGDIAEVRARLAAGADPNVIDAAGFTGLHHAAADGYLEVVKVLVESVADIEAHNKNLETPLLLASRKANLKSVQLLVEKKANLGACDVQRRSALVHAIKANHVELIRFFLDSYTTLNVADIQWGWTPLHYAASVGNLEVVKLLIDRKASKFKISKLGLTAQEVAQKCQRTEVAAYLRELTFQDPAQKVVWNEDGLQIWIGSKQAAYPGFANSLGFECFVVLNDHNVEDPALEWIEKEEDLNLCSVRLKVSDDDRTDKSWRELMMQLGMTMEFMIPPVEQNKRLLICCDSGVSTCTTLLVAFLLLKRRMRVKESTEHIRKYRRQAMPSPSMWRGLCVLEQGLDREKMRSLDARVKRCELFDLAR